jgi:hypothetical protein
MKRKLSPGKMPNGSPVCLALPAMAGESGCAASRTGSRTTWLREVIPCF